MLLQTDSLGRVPSGKIRLWLDDDVVDRAAPEGWVHVQTAEAACLWLLTGRVAEMSLDHDLGSDEICGRGMDVVDFLDQQWVVAGQSLWPEDGITLHTANPYGRDMMARAILRAAARSCRVQEECTPGGKRRFLFS